MTAAFSLFVLLLSRVYYCRELTATILHCYKTL